MIAFDFLFVVVCSLAVFFDLSVRRIPNWLIVLGLLAGVGLNLFKGTGSLVLSVAGFFVGVAVLFVPFAFGWMGAGDVKFFGVLGAILGVDFLPRVFFYSALVAGAIAIGYTVFGHFNPAFFKNSWEDFKVAIVTLGGVMPESIAAKASRGSHSVPWGVAFGAGAIISFYIDPSGKWAGF